MSLHSHCYSGAVMPRYFAQLCRLAAWLHCCCYTTSKSKLVDVIYLYLDCVLSLAELLVQSTTAQHAPSSVAWC